ncbi:hypothetical protein NOCA2480096 [metagenome]|uniref:Sulfate permease n=1 Tax=metagenome TaxID=256318 RepID=A0A2P2C7W7_9ZZZZ
MRFYMPTNRAVDWLRTPRGLKWAVPVALVATPAYLFAMSVCATLIERGALGYLNVLVLLFAWNALKFAVMGVMTPWLLLCQCWSAHQEKRSNAIGATSVMVNSGRA